MSVFYKKCLSLLLCIIVLISASGCAIDAGLNEEEEDRPRKSKTQKTEDFEYERLVICGYELPDKDYFIKSRSGSDYLMVGTDAFKYAFQMRIKSS